MDDRLRIVLAQLDLRVGDIHGNAARMRDAALDARDRLGAAVVVFPELALTGYPPEDLLLRPALHQQVLEALDRLRQQVAGIHMVVGHPHQGLGGLYNAVSVLRDGRVLATGCKQHLPNYSVFDEKRYFVPGEGGCLVDIQGLRTGITICEDVWHPGPAERLRAAGAEVLINVNASPFHADKGREREAVVRDRIRETGIPVLYLNLVGGQDELVFDGESFVLDGAGNLVQRAPACVEALVPVDLVREAGGWRPLAGEQAPVGDPEARIYRVLVLGVRDYVEKNGFSGAVLGLSGGIDSALTLAIAVDALGSDRVEAVMMPSRYTAAMSIEDARAEAEALGVAWRMLSIERPFGAFLEVLADEFAGRAPDVTEENIQARCRGTLLMAISNKFGRILLTTGNKSEMAVGYATLYGDMAGGFAPIKDVPKTLVYRLARYRNGLAPVIPQRVLERPPSAELRPDQTDQDSLPPYEVLDPILQQYVEEDRSLEEIVAAGFDPAVVQRVARLVDRNEYKRRQAPPGVRITRRAFGRDRRYPITSAFLASTLEGRTASGLHKPGGTR